MKTPPVPDVGNEPQTESPCPACRTWDACVEISCPFKDGWVGLRKNGTPMILVGQDSD